MFISKDKNRFDKAAAKADSPQIHYVIKPVNNMSKMLENKTVCVEFDVFLKIEVEAFSEYIYCCSYGALSVLEYIDETTPGCLFTFSNSPDIVNFH